MNKYYRNCPICNSEIEYTNKRSWYNAKARNSKCKSCQNIETKQIVKKKIQKGETWGGQRNRKKELLMERNYHRNCPSCGNQMSYTSLGTIETAIKNNTICNSCSAYKYNKNWKHKVTDESIKKMRASKAGFGSWEEYVEKYPEKEMYKREVWKYTNRNNLQELKHIEKRGRCGVDGAYQLDHNISINDGWKYNIPPEIIGEIGNLRMIPWKENLLKQ